MNGSNLTCRLRAAALPLLWLALAAVGAVRCEGDEAAAGGDLPVRYRRVFVPADHVDQWPKENLRYVPVSVAEFQRLLDAATQKNGAGDGTGLAAGRVLEAEYTARMEGDEFLAGEARLQIVHDAAAPSLVALAPCGIALADPQWLENDKPSRPAVLGLDQDGLLRLLVAKAGTLRCGWSARGRREPSGDVHFSLSLPSATSSRLILTLPEPLVPRVDLGVVVPAGQASEGSRPWRIELGGRHTAQLHIGSGGAAGEPARQNVVRQTLAYDFSPRGLEVSARLVVDVHGEPVRELVVQLDPSLRLMDAHLGETPLTWSFKSGGQADPPRVALEFPEPLVGPRREVELRAVAPLMLGERRKLPYVRPQGVFWQEATATLLLPRPLALVDLQLSGCRQSNVEPSPGIAAGESLELQYYAPDAEAEVLVDRQEPLVRVAATTSLELNPRQIRGRFVAQCSVDDGERFALSAELAPRWRLDSVESDPPGVVEDWFVRPLDDARQRLTVRLSKAITPQRPLRLVVSGRLNDSPLSRPVPHAQLQMLDMPAAIWQQRIVGLRASAPYQLHVEGDEDLVRRDPQKLFQAANAWIDDALPELAYVDDVGAQRLEASLLRQAPGHAAVVQVLLQVRDRLLDESYRITCRPDPGGIDRLLVHVSLPREEPLVWSLEDGSAERITARRLDVQQQLAAGFGRGGETWEVVLERTRSRPFELLARRVLPFEGPVPAALVAVGSVAKQVGMLTVRSATGDSITLDNRRLKPIPAALVDDRLYNTVRATYRYDPVRDASQAGPPPLVVSPAARSLRAPGAVVWRAWYESRYDLSGHGTHAVTFRMENAGLRSFQVTLVPGSIAQQVSIDGVPTHPRSGNNPADLQIELPTNQRFPTVRVNFTTEQRPLGSWARLSPPLPTTNLPVLVWHGNLWTPPEYRVVAAEGTSEADHPVPSWRERLFGPVARPAGGEPFDPLRWGDWLRLAGQEPQHREAQRRIAVCLRRLGIDNRGKPLQWGELLSASVDHASTPLSRLLVDRWALARSEITPQTPVEAVMAHDSLQRGIARLLSGDLMLLVGDETLVLTSADASAVHQNEVRPFYGGAAGFLGSGALADQVRRGADDRSADDMGLVSYEQWAAGAADVQLPWAATAEGRFRARQQNGWTATPDVLLGAEGPRVLVVRDALWTTTRWSLLLLLTAGLWWLYPRRARAWYALLGFFTVAALLLPSCLVPLGSTLLLGSCGAGLLALLFPSRPRQAGRGVQKNRGSSGSIPTTVSHAVAGILLLGLGLGLAEVPRCAALAAEPGATAPDAAIVYPVFVPIGPDKQPVGDTWYLPLEFFNELHHRAAARSVERRGWLITGATYRGRLDWNVGHTRLGIAELKATYELEVYGHQTQLRLPLGRGGASLLAEGTTLDGRPIEPVWDDQGRALLIDIPQSGRYRLELALQPTAQETDFEQIIPPLATSRLELTIPPDASQIDIPTSLGAVRSARTAGNITAQLGSAERLLVVWPQPSAGAQPQIDVDQLVWLKVKPGEVTVETRLKLRGGEGRLRRFQLLADPRLRLLPLPREASGAVQVHVLAGDPQTIVVELARSVDDEQNLALSFLWTETSGLGHLRLPLLTPVEARTYAGWLAVSVDPSLRYDVEGGEALAAAPAAELLPRWDFGSTAPDLVYRLRRGDVSWSLATRPCPPQTTFEPTLALSFAGQQAYVRLEAALETAAGYVFRYRLRVPPGFTATDVSLRQAGTPCLSRWSQSKSGLTIFLKDPVIGRQQLSVRGMWRLPGTDIPWPDFRLENCTLGKFELAVYRQPGVQVRVANTEALREAGDASAVLSKFAGSPLRRFGRLAGVYQLVDVQSGPILSIRLQPPHMEATQITSLKRQEGVWHATVDYRLHVLEGTADTLRFEVPASLSGPFQIEPPEPSRLIDMPGTGQRHLVIRPRDPVRQHMRLSISSPLALAGGDRVGVPAVVPLGVDAVVRYVVLPKRVDQQKVDWELRGLEPEPLPHDPDSTSPSDASVASYRVAGERFQAVLVSVAKIEKTPRVRLADVRLAWDEAGDAAGLATFDLEPAGLSTCGVSLPPGMRLVQARIGGLPAVFSAVDHNQWEVTLGSDQLPQRIEVLFQGRVPADRESRRALAAPLLRNGSSAIAVERTLWTLQGPASQALSAEAPSGRRIPAWEQQRQRLESMTELLGEATSEESIEVMAPWYQRWARNVVECRRQIERLRAAAAGTDREALDKFLAENQRRQEAIARRLRTGDVLRSVTDEPLRTEFETGLWHFALNPQHPPLRLSFAGAQASLAVRRGKSLDGDFAGRLGLATGLIGLMWLGTTKKQSRRMGELLVRWPHAAVVGLALLAWLLLWPSAVGLLVAGAGVAGGWRAWGIRE